MSGPLQIVRGDNESPEQAKARASLSPENLSAATMTLCQTVGEVPVTEMARELKRQTAAMTNGDMTRAESMLLAQAHTLDSLFASLTTRAFAAKEFERIDGYLRLALKAQNQARATLQTLGELKAPKQVAFVKQANIGNQVQVNNGERPARTGKAKPRKRQNKQLEVEHGERMDTRAAGAPSEADPHLEALER